MTKEVVGLGGGTVDPKSCEGQDRDTGAAGGVAVEVTNTIMSARADKQALARAVLAFAGRIGANGESPTQGMHVVEWFHLS